MVVNDAKAVAPAVTAGANTILNAATGAYDVAKDQVTGIME